MSKVEYTYNEFTGKLWAEDFTTFCIALRDLCGLKVDPDKSHIILSSRFQEYFIDGTLHGVDCDGMPQFLADQGVANDVLRSRATPANWELYLTETEGLGEKYDSLIEAGMKPKSVEQIVDSVFVSEEETVEESPELEDSGLVATEEEITEETVEVASDVVVMTADIVAEDTTEEESLPESPDFEYAKTLMEGDDEATTMKALQEYAAKFGIKLGGKTPKGRYLSFTNKWAKMQKEAGKA